MTTVTVPDLWPRNLSDSATEPSPVAILRQQGYKLGEHTDEVVFGEIVSEFIRPDHYNHEFFLVSPPFKVRHRLFNVHHKVGNYPCDIKLYFNDKVLDQKTDLQDSSQFMHALQELLANELVVSLVQSLNSQFQEID